LYHNISCWATLPSHGCQVTRATFATTSMLPSRVRPPLPLHPAHTGYHGPCTKNKKSAGSGFEASTCRLEEAAFHHHNTFALLLDRSWNLFIGICRPTCNLLDQSRHATLLCLDRFAQEQRNASVFLFNPEWKIVIGISSS
jgi:hypothetical protein